MPLIRVENLSKHYGGICALDRASLDIEAGEIHALCGENGAGKSTLNKILSGSVSPDSGSVSIAGEAIPASVAAAERLGIAIVQQETTVFPDLDAAANIFLNRESSPFWLDIRAGHREAKSLLQSLGESFPVDVPLAHLSHAQQQMVGISRALALKCQLLILDEPTASLSVRESEALFTAIRKLCSEGVAILYVTHRLDEVFALADRVTVLRDGAHVLTSAVSELDRDSLIAAMVGRPLGMSPESRDALPSPTEKRGQARALPKGLSIQAGEIVGMFGLVGAGRSEFAQAAAEQDPAIAYIPEDRQHQGLHLDMSISDNLFLVTSRSSLWMDRKQEATEAQHLAQSLLIKAPAPGAPVRSLSGGNQQKVMLGKWLACKPEVLILDEPTRGVDVGAKAEIHRQIRAIADEGTAVLMISSELPEILAVSDRMVVMREGEISGEMSGEEATEQALLNLALPEGSTHADAKVIRKRIPAELPVAAVLALAIISCTIANSAFLSLENIRDLLVKISPTVIVGTALTMVIVAGEIDISVGALMGICAAALGVLAAEDRLGLHPAFGIAGCLGVGALAGMLSGALVGKLKVPSIIVGLGLMTILQGVSEWLLAGKWISQMPPELRSLGTGTNIVFVALLTLLAGVWLTRKTAFGRAAYAIGSNLRAAELVGVPVGRTKMVLFALCGFVAGLAALFSATQLQVIESGFGRGFELTAVAAVVVGGTSIRGGRGSMLGTVLGAILLGSIGTMLIFLKLGESSVYWERAIGGAVILAAVIADFWSRRREGK